MLENAITRTLVLWSRIALAAAAVGCASVATPNASATSLTAFSQHVIVVQGRSRTYELFAPDAVGVRAPRPLVIVLHGGRSRGRGMERLTHFSDVAERHGFVVAYPDGLDGQWNDGRGLEQYTAHRENVDDVAFIAALIEEVGRRTPIARGQVYLTGMSNGGLMAHRVACEAAHLVTAIAPVEGVISERIAQTCPAPDATVPVLLIKGAAAPVFERNSRRLTARETAEFWARRAGCALEPEVSDVADRDPNDGTRTRRVAFGRCAGGAEVVLLDVEGGGHTWPGGRQYLPEDVIGRTSRDFDASEEIWRFFSSHRR